MDGGWAGWEIRPWRWSNTGRRDRRGSPTSSDGDAYRRRPYRMGGLRGTARLRSRWNVECGVGQEQDPRRACLSGDGSLWCLSRLCPMSRPLAPLRGNAEVFASRRMWWPGSSVIPSGVPKLLDTARHARSSRHVRAWERASHWPCPRKGYRKQMVTLHNGANTDAMSERVARGVEQQVLGCRDR